MRGYHGMPDQTAAVLDADGWFSTGDVGEIDEGGRMRITDRKKDLVKTSGGKYIAPSVIETRLEVAQPDHRSRRRARRQTQLRERAHHPRPGRRARSGLRPRA